MNSCEPGFRRGATFLALPIVCCATHAVLLGVVGAAAAFRGATGVGVLLGLAALNTVVVRLRRARREVRS